jgi:hypothetical protein
MSGGIGYAFRSPEARIMFKLFRPVVDLADAVKEKYLDCTRMYRETLNEIDGSRKSSKDLGRRV